MKEIVAFFSRRGDNYVKDTVEYIKIGNVNVLANYIQGKTYCDVWHIETNDGYSEDYYEATQKAKKELDENARPELYFVPKNIDEYSRIYLGYPIWHGTCPMAILTFLENTDLSGKTIIPFCTHEGSGIANSINDIRKSAKNAIIKDCFETRGYRCQSLDSDDELKSELDKWLEATK